MCPNIKKLFSFVLLKYVKIFWKDFPADVQYLICILFCPISGPWGLSLHTLYMHICAYICIYVHIYMHISTIIHGGCAGRWVNWGSGAFKDRNWVAKPSHSRPHWGFYLFIFFSFFLSWLVKFSKTEIAPLTRKMQGNIMLFALRGGNFSVCLSIGVVHETFYIFLF